MRYIYVLLTVPTVTQALYLKVTFLFHRALIQSTPVRAHIDNAYKSIKSLAHCKLSTVNCALLKEVQPNTHTHTRTPLANFYISSQLFFIVSQMLHCLLHIYIHVYMYVRGELVSAIIFNLSDIRFVNIAPYSSFSLSAQRSVYVPFARNFNMAQTVANFLCPTHTHTSTQWHVKRYTKLHFMHVKKVVSQNCGCCRHCSVIFQQISHEFVYFICRKLRLPLMRSKWQGKCPKWKNDTNLCHIIRKLCEWIWKRKSIESYCCAANLTEGIQSRPKAADKMSCKFKGVKKKRKKKWAASN